MRWQRRNDQSHNKQMLQISSEEDETRPGRQGDHLENEQTF